MVHSRQEPLPERPTLYFLLIEISEHLLGYQANLATNEMHTWQCSVPNKLSPLCLYGWKSVYLKSD